MDGLSQLLLFLLLLFSFFTRISFTDIKRLGSESGIIGTIGLVLCSINCTSDLPDSLGLGSEFPSPALLSGSSLWHASKFKSEVGGGGGLETRLSKSRTIS